MKKKKIIKIIVSIISILSILMSLVIVSSADSLQYHASDGYTSPDYYDMYLHDARIAVKYKFLEENDTNWEEVTYTKDLGHLTTTDHNLGVLGSQVAIENDKNGAYNYDHLIVDTYNVNTSTEETKIIVAGDPARSLINNIDTEKLKTTGYDLYLNDVYINDTNIDIPLTFEFIIPLGVTASSAIARIKNCLTINGQYEMLVGRQANVGSAVNWTREFHQDLRYEITDTYNEQTRRYQVNIKLASLPDNMLFVRDEPQANGEQYYRYDKASSVKCDFLISWNFENDQTLDKVFTAGVFQDASGNNHINMYFNTDIYMYSKAYWRSNFTTFESNYEDSTIAKMNRLSVIVKEDIAVDGFINWISNAVNGVMEFKVGEIAIGDILNVIIIISLFIIILKVFAGG